MSGISLNQLKNVARENLDGDLRVSRDSQETLVNKGTLGNKIATFFDSIGRALGLISDDTRQLRQQEALRGFSDSLKDHYGADVAQRALRQAGLIDDHGGLDPQEGPYNLVKDRTRQVQHVDERGAVHTDYAPLQALTGRVTLQILETAEKLRQQTLERVEEIACDCLPGGASFTAMVDELKGQEIMSEDGLPPEIIDEYAIRLRERFRLECDSGRRTIEPRQLRVELTEDRLKAVAREVLVGTLGERRDEGIMAREQYQQAMTSLLDKVLDDAEPDDIQQAIEDSLRALKERQEIDGKPTGVKDKRGTMGVTFDDRYIMEQTLIAELGRRLENGEVSREALEGLQQRLLGEGSTLRQLHEQNARPLKDTRSMDIETQRQEILERQERKDRARHLMDPPVALVGALARVLGTVTNLHGNDIGTFTSRS